LSFPLAVPSLDVACRLRGLRVEVEDLVSLKFPKSSPRTPTGDSTVSRKRAREEKDHRESGSGIAKEEEEEEERV